MFTTHMSMSQHQQKIQVPSPEWLTASVGVEIEFQEKSSIFKQIQYWLQSVFDAVWCVQGLSCLSRNISIFFKRFFAWLLFTNSTASWFCFRKFQQRKGMVGVKCKKNFVQKNCTCIQVLIISEWFIEAANIRIQAVIQVILLQWGLWQHSTSD